jgi:CMP-N-acetylneuraminic acid synthetase
MEDVIIDVLDSTGLQEDAFVLLQPTSPIRDRAYLEEAIRMLRDVSCVISTDPWGRRNGNLFVCRIPYFRQYEFGGPSVCHLPMPAMMSLDIDTDTDLAAYRQVEKEALNCQ